MKKADLAGTITLAPPSATSDIWTRRFPDPVTAFASGWMRVRARARQRGVELPLVISDHADWDGLTATIEATGAGEIWVTHGQEDALVHWCKTKGLAARPLDLVGYGDEDESEALPAERGRGMNRFAELLDRLAYEPGRNNKLRLITAYFREIADPDRGYALAALTGALSFKHAKPGLIRDLITDRTDPVLFGLSYDYVGDLSETVALMWPKAAARLGHNNPPPPTLTEVVTTLRTLGKTELPKQLARWLDELDETGRWALLKLVTGAMRIGISARLAKTAAAALGDKDAARGRTDVAGPRAALSRPVRLAGRPRRKARQSRSGAVPPGDAGACDRGCGFRRARSPPISSRNGNGTASACRRSPAATSAATCRRGFIRAPARTSPKAFRTCCRRCICPARIDGELLVLRDGRVQTFQRAAAAAQPQSRLAKADEGISDPSARL